MDKTRAWRTQQEYSTFFFILAQRRGGGVNLNREGHRLPYVQQRIKLPHSLTAVGKEQRRIAGKVPSGVSQCDLVLLEKAAVAAALLP